MSNLIEFPSKLKCKAVGSSIDNKKFVVVLQSVITIEVEADACDPAAAKTEAIDKFRNNGIMDCQFSQTKYKVISVEGAVDKAKCN